MQRTSKMHLCRMCGKMIKNIHRHIREVHKLTDYVPTTLNRNNKCLEEGCFTSFNWVRDLRLHLEDEHNLKFETEHLKFSTLVEFKTWYGDLCHKENVQYNKHKHVISSYTASTTYYNCNRSGNSKEIQNGKRARKVQGTCKLNYSCTSQIKLVEQKNGYEVTYNKTHYGHSIELQHIRLSERQRNTVAAKLESGATFDNILDDVRDNIDGNLKRSDLVTKRDLRNIKNAFGVNYNESKKHKEDTISFEVWTEKQRSSENNYVLFCKKQGEKLSHSIIDLKQEDLCLIIMNKYQKTMLGKFGQTIVTIEITPEVNSSGFEVTTLMVIDEHGEGFPVACMFANRHDTYIYTLFFSTIKDKCGIIAPKVFMTDITDVYYNAWIQIMNIPLFRLYGLWHVDCAWKPHLDTIFNLEKKDFVCKVVKYLQTNLDEDDFTRELEKSVDIFIKDYDTNEFGLYFKNNYLENVKMWAYCYRRDCGINTNVHVESMPIKSLQSLDKGLHAVLTFIRHKTVEHIVKLTKEKNFHTEQIENCHRIAVMSEFNVEIIDNNQFKVCTEDESCYTIRKQNVKNSCCKLICQSCQICIHAYSCECTDFLIEPTICEHIHMVSINNNSIQNKDCSRKQYQDIEDEVPIHVTNLEDSNKTSDIDKSKAYTYKMLSFIETEVDNLSDNMDVSQINESLNQTKSELNIIKAKEKAEEKLLKNVTTHSANKEAGERLPLKVTTHSANEEAGEKLPIKVTTHLANTNVNQTKSELNIVKAKEKVEEELPIKATVHSANKQTEKKLPMKMSTHSAIKKPGKKLPINVTVHLANETAGKKLPLKVTIHSASEKAEKKLPIKVTTHSANKRTGQPLPIKMTTRSANKNVNKELSIHSTKRKKKTKRHTCLKKPNLEEENDIRAILFQ